MNSPATDNPLPGVWKLHSYSIVKQNNDKVLLWGENPSGMLIYLPNGYMSVQVSNADRMLFEKGDFLAGTGQEISEAFEGYTAYYGRYEYLPEKQLVCHYVDQSLYPNWSGAVNERYAALDGDCLTLSTPPVSIAGEPCTMSMHWRRVKE